MRRSYIVLGSKSWNRTTFDGAISRLPGEWHFISSPDELTIDAIKQISPDKLFFLHWSWRVPGEIFNTFECVNFHMTDVPFGRGGSPLQNLIIRGHTDTQLSALRMTEGWDSGAVYLKKPLSLDGPAHEILKRASALSGAMIEEILRTDIKPRPQEGDATVFRRRTPDESRLPSDLSVERMYDFIRMLDGEGYPPAFIDRDGFRYEFTGANLTDKNLFANVAITALTDSASPSTQK